MPAPIPSAPPTPLPRSTKQTHQGRVDVAKALKLRLQGNTLREIGAVFGVTDSAIHQSLKNFEPFVKNLQPGDLTAYNDERRNILTAAEGHLLRSMMDEEAIRKAPLAARTMAFGVVFDKRRLEEGKSTENVGILGKLILSAEQELGKPSTPPVIDPPPVETA